MCRYHWSYKSTSKELCPAYCQPLHVKVEGQPKTSVCESLNALLKSVEYVRVNGGTDEGPDHEEMQFWWRQQHIVNARLATLVTTHRSGSSYVKMQNSCLSSYIYSNHTSRCLHRSRSRYRGCKWGEGTKMSAWTHLPLLTADADRLWGNTSCDTCNDIVMVITKWSSLMLT